MFQITVHAGPHIAVQKNNQISSKKGDRLSFTCDITGDKPIEVVWKTKNGEILRSHGKYDIENNENSDGLNSILHIGNLELEDQGEILCIAVCKILSQR